MTHYLSPAKINWYLRVLGLRPDGYHDIETVFQTIDLADDLEFEPIGAEECRIEGFGPDVPVSSNLIYRAWTVLRAEFPTRVPGVHVKVTKRIPQGGGLGGGSSNAATTLKALNDLFDLDIDVPGLEVRAARLGSDVPFFIRGGCATATGRGEILQQVSGAGKFHLVLLIPRVAVSTGQAYAALDRIPREASDFGLADVIEALRSGDPKRLGRRIHNDFEAVVSESAWFCEAIARLRDAGCGRPFLTGSGSTVVAPAADEEHARAMLIDLQSYASGSVISTMAGNFGAG
jgi:4-diphosphocytidyl-2-C-methyl-D-erythritol kinase